jgi:iron complex outermembrane recepter protein
MWKQSMIVVLTLSGGVFLEQSAIAKDAVEAKILRVNQIQRPASPVEERQAQIEAATQVKNVKLERTATRLDIVLETAEGKPLQVDTTKFRTDGDSLIADIPNAVLALPQGKDFVAENPTTDIATVQVMQESSTIRITVTGSNTLPKTEVTLKTGELVYSLNPESDEPDEEIVATGQQDGYRVPNSSVGTKTDTPLRDIPQSIQIVPQEVLRDQQINRLDDALRNVPGVTSDFDSGPYLTYRIRGFEALNNNLLRNGLVDAGAGESVELSSVERVEVLKGPASVLFGLGNPGGSINIITKQPLQESLYAISANIGSYDFYRGAVDFSGPLNDSKSVLYRFNAAYRNSDSFIDFYNSEHLNISPVVSIAIGEKTKLTLEGDYIKTSDSGFTPFVPVIGSVLPNPNGEIPRNPMLVNRLMKLMHR